MHPDVTGRRLRHIRLLAAPLGDGLVAHELEEILEQVGVAADRHAAGGKHRRDDAAYDEERRERDGMVARLRLLGHGFATAPLFRTLLLRLFRLLLYLTA